MIAIIRCDTIGTPLIQRAVKKSGYKTVVIPERKLDSIRERDDITGIIISGKSFRFDAASTADHLTRFGILLHVDVPMLGICFGHQIIGMLHGAHVWSEHVQRGSNRITFLRDDPLLVGIPTHADMFESHGDHIDVPPPFMRLAHSNACTNEMMRHREKPIYGVQFHPEFSGKYGTQLLTNFAKVCEK